MSASGLLEALTRQGFTLRAENHGIRVHPASRLSAGLRQAIVTNRAGLLELLRGAEAPSNQRAASAVTDLAELAEWFRANLPRLPQEPFGLVPGRRSGWAVWVAYPARFYAALRMDLMGESS